MKNRKHYIMTRFNLGLYHRFDEVKASIWMNNRLGLFSKYCVPSVKGQVCRSFKWIIFADDRTSQEHRNSLSKIMSESLIDHSIFYCKWPEDRKWMEKHSLCSDGFDQFYNLVSQECALAIMTRLDNDDALSVNYVENCQNEINCTKKPQFVVDFRYGIMYDIRNGECWYAEHEVGSPFITLVEKVSTKMNTVYGSYHRKIASMYTCEQSIVREPMWMMIIHDGNTTNRIFDHMKVSRVDYGKIRKEFS